MATSSPDLHESILKARIDFKDHILNDLLNKYIDHKFNATFNLKLDKLNVEVVKEKNLNLQWDDDLINLKIPFRLNVSRQKGLGSFKANAGLIIFTSTEFSITRNWQLTTNSHVKEIQWIAYPSLLKGNLNLPLKWIIKPFEKKIKRKVAEGIDSILRSKLDLKIIALNVIREIQNLANTNPLAGHLVHLTFSTFALGSIKVMQRDSFLEFGLTGLVEVTDEPVKVLKNQELPKFFMKHKNANSSLWLKFSLNDQNLSEYINTESTGKEIFIKDYVLIIDQFAISFEPDVVKLNIRFKGDYRGEVEVLSHPRLEVRNKGFILSDLEINMIKGNLLLKSVFMVIRSKLKAEIKKWVETDLYNYNKFIQEKINQFLAEQAKVTGIDSNIKLHELQPEWLNIQSQRLEIICYSGFLAQIRLSDANKIYNRFLA